MISNVGKYVVLCCLSYVCAHDSYSYTPLILSILRQTKVFPRRQSHIKVKTSKVHTYYICRICNLVVLGEWNRKISNIYAQGKKIVDLTSRFLQVLTMPWNLIDIQYQIIQQEKESNPGSRDSQSRSKGYENGSKSCF